MQTRICKYKFVNHNCVVYSTICAYILVEIFNAIYANAIRIYSKHLSLDRPDPTSRHEPFFLKTGLHRDSVKNDFPHFFHFSRWCRASSRRWTRTSSSGAITRVVSTATSTRTTTRTLDSMSVQTFRTIFYLTWTISIMKPRQIRITRQSQPLGIPRSRSVDVFTQL